MGWNRGLGRRSWGRLYWSKTEVTKSCTSKYLEKKLRMEELARKKRAKDPIQFEN